MALLRCLKLRMFFRYLSLPLSLSLFVYLDIRKLFRRYSEIFEKGEKETRGAGVGTSEEIKEEKLKKERKRKKEKESEGSTDPSPRAGYS